MTNQKYNINEVNKQLLIKESNCDATAEPSQGRILTSYATTEVCVTNPVQTELHVRCS